MVNTSWKAGERMKIYCDTCGGGGLIYQDYNDIYEKCENCKGKGYTENDAICSNIIIGMASDYLKIIEGLEKQSAVGQAYHWAYENGIVTIDPESLVKKFMEVSG